MNRLFLVGALALMVGLAACGETETQGGDSTPTCDAGDTLCGLSCVDTLADARNCGACGTACAEGEICSDGACAVSCPAGQANCDGACFDLDSSADNCGACGTTCAAGESCSEGSCVAECPAGQAACGGGCFDLDRSRDNCGACGTVCDAGQICTEGTCETSCPAGQVACDGACYNLETSGENCGGCGNVCSDGQVCVDGACGTSCTAGLTDCSGSCLDLDADRANCGACGNACGADELCIEGSCALTCAPGTTECGGTCRDTDLDRNNCGGCGVACDAAEICSEGACVPSCGPYASDVCDGACTNFTTDPQNCGACGNTCAEGEVCSEGACADACLPTADVCADGCTSFQHDPNNCGACGTTCVPAANATAVCGSGSCGSVCLQGYGDCDSDMSGFSSSNGCEVNLNDTVEHCGACGAACPSLPNATTTCTNGVCGVGTCAAGFADCDGNPDNGCEVDTRSDANHCSQCFASCGGNFECRNSACTAPGAGDLCSSAFPLVPGTNTVRIDAYGREYLVDVDSVSCSSTAPNGPDAVLQYTATATGGARVKLEKPNTRRWHLVVGDAPCGSVTDQLRCVSAGANALEASFGVTAGETYFIYVVGTSTSTSHLLPEFQVTIEEFPDATAGIGDICATAVPITNGTTHVPWVATVNHYVANDISCTSDTTRPDGPDVVLRYDATHDGGVELLIDNPGARRWFAVVSSDACGTIENEAACIATPFGVGATRALFNVTNGQSYYVYVTGSTLGTGVLDHALDVTVNDITCSSIAPTVVGMYPVAGEITTSFRPTIEMTFSHEVNITGGTITLTGDQGTVATIDVASPAVKRSNFNKTFTIAVDEPFRPGEQITITWSGIVDQACSTAVAPLAAPWTITTVDAGCYPGEGGLIGTEITRVPMNALGSVSEHYVAVDSAADGYVYIGGIYSAGNGPLVRMRKSGGAFENIAMAAKLGADHLGYTMLVDGDAIYTVNEKTSGVDKRLWRISTDGGATWVATDVAKFGTSTSNDPEGGFRGVAAHSGRIHLITQNTTSSKDTEIWSVDPTGTLPATARLDVSFGAGTYTYCQGLAMDDASYFTACRTTKSTTAVLRIARSDGAVTELTELFPGNTQVAAVHVKDHDADGLADFLYFQSDKEEAYFLCAPNTATPHGELLQRFGTDTGNYGMALDSTGNALWMFDDDTFEFVKIH